MKTLIFGKISLRMVLVVPFVMLVVAAVGLTGYLSFLNGQTAVNDVASQLRSEITGRIEQHLRSFLKIPHQINQFNINAIEHKLISLEQPEIVRHHFWKQIQNYPSVGFIYWARRWRYCGWT